MFVLVDGKKETESDSKKTILEAVKNLLKAGRGCVIEIVVGNSVRPPLPPVADPDRSDIVPDTPKRRKMSTMRVRRK
jgi:hypothetical protein